MRFFFQVAAAAVVCAAMCASTQRLGAQDTRTVTEPVIPPVCQTLKAELTANGGIAAGDEQKLDTARVQKGFDECAPGHALELASDGGRNAFLTGPLQLRKGVTLLVDKGVTLYGSRDPKVYEKSPGSCGMVNNERAGCNTLIVANHADDAGIMGDGVIDGRGGLKLLVDGKDSNKTWWDLAEDARKGGRQQVPRLIEMEASNNFTLYRITLKNSANFHVVYHHGDGFTVWGLKIDTPRNARNTDGVDPSSSKNITVTQSYIRDGDDNIAIKGGDGPVTNMTVIHNHFYYGHGMSIGSETNGGVSAIRVTDLSLDGDDDAIRIKSNPSRGGLVHDVVYDDVCIRNSKAPVFMDTPTPRPQPSPSSKKSAKASSPPAISPTSSSSTTTSPKPPHRRSSTPRSSAPSSAAKRSIWPGNSQKSPRDDHHNPPSQMPCYLSRESASILTMECLVDRRTAGAATPAMQLDSY